ncbi:amidase [Clavulina sp. PMI_390]|nr:amidase [Clavulina sp. PMI_390]
MAPVYILNESDISHADAASKKRAEREAILAKYSDWRPILPPATGIPLDASNLILSRLTAEESRIVHLDATALVEAMASRQLSAVQVTTAFAKAAVAAQDLTNCLTEIFIEQGLARAQELDEHLVRTGRVVGPLHGLPVSIKDHILIKGLDTASGYISWAGKTVADRDAVVVDILRKAGAVLYVKTANPQTLLSLETHNFIYGRTVNPFNRNLSSGGSSGGEGALIASFGSPLGVGTDIGGSIRIPAAHNGLYGMKASVARMPHAGLMGSHDGMDNIVGVVGPLARSARDLALFSKVMLQYNSWDLEAPVLRMPWKDAVVDGKDLPKKLCIAVLMDDGVVRPHPPLLRELEDTKNALIAAGHEVIEWEPLDHQLTWDLIVRLYFLDGGEEYMETLAEGQEQPTPSFGWIHSLIEGAPPLTARQTWRLNGERERLRQRALMHWNATKARTSTGRPVDAILCPTFPTVAAPHDTTRWWGYTAHWNLVDYPAVIFPTGRRVTVADYLDTDESLPEGRNDAEKFINAQWNPKTYENAPISLQLVGRRHDEESLLAMLNVVEAARASHAKKVTAHVSSSPLVSTLPQTSPPIPTIPEPAHEFASVATAVSA